MVKNYLNGVPVFSLITLVAILVKRFDYAFDYTCIPIFFGFVATFVLEIAMKLIRDKSQGKHVPIIDRFLLALPTLIVLLYNFGFRFINAEAGFAYVFGGFFVMVIAIFFVSVPLLLSRIVSNDEKNG